MKYRFTLDKMVNCDRSGARMTSTAEQSRRLRAVLDGLEIAVGARSDSGDRSARYGFICQNAGGQDVLLRTVRTLFPPREVM